MQANVEGFLFFLGMPSVAYVGYNAAKLYFDRTVGLHELTNPYRVRTAA